MTTKYSKKKSSDDSQNHNLFIRWLKNTVKKSHQLNSNNIHLMNKKDVDFLLILH